MTSLSAALALAALESPPDVTPVVEERERLASSLRALGFAPLDSHANFLFVPVEDPRALGDTLLRQGLAVRVFAGGIRISVLDHADDDLLVEALARALDRPSPVAPAGARRVRRVRATAETRIAVRLALDGASRVRVATGAGIYDHFLEQLAFHAGFDLIVEGDRRPRDRRPPHRRGHGARGRRGVERGPGRPARHCALRRRRGADGRRARAGGGRPRRAPAAELKLELDPGLAAHVLGSLSQAARVAIHVESTGRDAHHVAEAAFKAVGRALRVAVRVESDGIPSTKGLL